MIKTVGIVIPVYNEVDNIPLLYARLQNVMDTRADLAFRLIFVNDGSRDGSTEVLDELANAHGNVVVFHLSRNFGHQIAVTAGIDHATDDVVCLIDADLQDPPELLVDMIDEIENGYDIVYGRRKHRKGETWMKRATAKAFYRVLSAMTHVDIPPDTGDFRAMRANVADVLRSMRERHRFIRGMVAWTGFRSKALDYVREARYAGKTKYSLRKMIHFASDAIFSFSDVPLRLSKYLGFLASLIGLAGIAYILVQRFAFNNYVPGVSSTFFAVLFMGGVQLITLGIIGDYIGRIFEQSKQRPLYVIAVARNLDETAEKLRPVARDKMETASYGHYSKS